MSEIEKPEDAPAAENHARGEQRKRDKRDVHGWVVLDKPVGMTSTHAVAVVKRLFSAKRAGHAGTLDPLASGCLPIALGEATKTVPFIMDGRKALPLHRALGRGARYRRRRRPRGRNERGASAARCGRAPCCPQFTGTIEQVPPRYSAIKIEGERAYDLARDGQEVVLQSRLIESARSIWLRAPIRTMRCSRPNAAKAPMSGRWPAIWAGFWAVLAMFRPCGGPRSAPSARLQ